MIYDYPHRTLCDVLSEMRTIHETRNYSGLLALIEEAQSMGNRMEAGLSYERDIKELHEERKKLVAKNKELRLRD